jgi:hypothetical protein
VLGVVAEFRVLTEEATRKYVEVCRVALLTIGGQELGKLEVLWDYMGENKKDCGGLRLQRSKPQPSGYISQIPNLESTNHLDHRLQLVKWDAMVPPPFTNA